MFYNMYNPNGISDRTVPYMEHICYLCDVVKNPRSYVQSDVPFDYVARGRCVH